MTNQTIPPNGIRHPKCGSWWTGRAVSHCAACCETFSSTTAFDLHQRKVRVDGELPGAPAGQLCRKPEDAGLTAAPKPYGILWSLPGSDSDWTRRELPDADEAIQVGAAR